MVLVTMSNDHADDLFLVLQQIRDVGNNQINPRQAFVGKLGASVYDDNIVAVLHKIHIFADFMDAAESANRQFGRLSGFVAIVNRGCHMDFCCLLDLLIPL